MASFFWLVFENSSRAAAVVLEIRSEANYGAPWGTRAYVITRATFPSELQPEPSQGMTGQKGHVTCWFQEVGRGQVSVDIMSLPSTFQKVVASSQLYSPD